MVIAAGGTVSYHPQLCKRWPKERPPAFNGFFPDNNFLRLELSNVSFSRPVVPHTTLEAVGALNKEKRVICANLRREIFKTRRLVRTAGGEVHRNSAGVRAMRPPSPSFWASGELELPPQEPIGPPTRPARGRPSAEKSPRKLQRPISMDRFKDLPADSLRDDESNCTGDETNPDRTPATLRSSDYRKDNHQSALTSNEPIVVAMIGALPDLPQQRGTIVGRVSKHSIISTAGSVATSSGTNRQREMKKRSPRTIDFSPIDTSGGGATEQKTRQKATRKSNRTTSGTPTRNSTTSFETFLKKKDGLIRPSRLSMEKEEKQMKEAKLIHATKGKIAQAVIKSSKNFYKARIKLALEKEDTVPQTFEAELSTMERAVRLLAQATGVYTGDLEKVVGVFMKYAPEEIEGSQDTLVTLGGDQLREVIRELMGVSQEHFEERHFTNAMRELDSDRSGTSDIVEFIVWYFKRENLFPAPFNDANHVKRVYFDPIAEEDPPSEILVRALARETKINVTNVATLLMAFEKFDQDESGELDMDELGGLLTLIAGAAPDETVLEQARQMLDSDKSGTVDFVELFCWYFASVLEGEVGEAEHLCKVLESQGCTYMLCKQKAIDKRAVLEKEKQKKVEDAERHRRASIERERAAAEADDDHDHHIF